MFLYDNFIHTTIFYFLKHLFATFEKYYIECIYLFSFQQNALKCLNFERNCKFLRNQNIMKGQNFFGKLVPTKY